MTCCQGNARDQLDHIVDADIRTDAATLLRSGEQTGTRLVDDQLAVETQVDRSGKDSTA